MHEKITLAQRVKVTYLYCLPALLACLILLYTYHNRITGIGNDIAISCENTNAMQCVQAKVTQCDSLLLMDESSENALIENSVDKKICDFRQKIAEDSNYLSNMPTTESNLTPNSAVTPTPKAISSAQLLVDNIKERVTSILSNIFISNAVAVLMLALLPYLLMGDLLAKSPCVNLTYERRAARANANWWLKFLLALIIGVGLLYIVNPLGRGASTYFQFFIAAGMDNTQTLPIYIKTEHMVPVLAGFFGWYLHLIGYVFTKLIHHDVTSARVYNLLFKKFLITYGLALVLPESGLIEDEKTAALMMFVLGLFPLSAMSLLIETVSKLGSNKTNASGNLSQLPGISRWQILRLEEEGIDSMAALANIEQKTIDENLYVIGKLTAYWMDIAQLYTVVGEEAYNQIKSHCLTASEFTLKANNPEFMAAIKDIEGVSDAQEISRLLTSTFQVSK